jgi:hypothetical protein
MNIKKQAVGVRSGGSAERRHLDENGKSAAVCRRAATGKAASSH